MSKSLPGAFLANSLHLVARNAYGAMDRSCGERDPQRNNQAVIAAVFSAISLESFINELVAMAEVGLDVPALARDEPARKIVGALASILAEVEASNGSIKLKYLTAHYVLSGEPWDKGAEPYQNFALLLDLRNAIVHSKPQEKIIGELALDNPHKLPELQPHPILKKLEGKSVLVPSTDQPPLVSWMSRISTVAMGRWVCNVAADTSRLIADRFPDCALKGWINQTAFERVD